MEPNSHSAVGGSFAGRSVGDSSKPPAHPDRHSTQWDRHADPFYSASQHDKVPAELRTVLPDQNSTVKRILRQAGREVGAAAG